ncbi:MAG: DUF3369 domain-containing protein [Motiliproteus sp.]
MEDELIFSDERDALPDLMGEPWKVLIIDDESEVHKVTKLALKRFVFDGRPLEFISAYSGREARTLLKTLSDVAIILLDVVMETEDAGLELVHFIRRDMQNETSRIILRTGQPGQAPEREVIREYDINDYKAKTELTSQKLFTLMHASLRSYRDIMTLEKSKQGLEKVINASRGVFEQRAFTSFVSGAMEQLLLLLRLDGSSIYTYDSLALQVKDTELKVLAASHDNEMGVDTIKVSQLPDKMKGIISEAIETKANVFHDSSLVIYCANITLTTLFFVEGVRSLTEIDRNLLSLFTENIVVALENIRLNAVIKESNKEVIYRLGEVIETRSEETGYHVKRVALYSELLAQLVGLSEEDAEVIKQASPLHDIGKVGVPDAVLNKPGKLDAAEWEVMKTHAQLGHDILQGSGNQLLDIAAEIAVSHHEKWNGSGYPNGLTEEQIPMSGRIVALADVFDAVGSWRCYKKPWPLEDILELLKKGSGEHFDPHLVDLFFDNFDKFMEIRDQYRDDRRSV